jgi:hypothetical protein
VTRGRAPDERTERRDEGGEILVLVLAALIVLGILAGALAALASPSLTHATVIRNVSDTVATADSGIEYGIQSLKTAPTQCQGPLPPAPTINGRAPAVSCTTLDPPDGTPTGISYVLLVSTAEIASSNQNLIESRAVLEINDQTGSATIISWRSCRNGEC